MPINDLNFKSSDSFLTTSNRRKMKKQFVPKTQENSFRDSSGCRPVAIEMIRKM